MQKTAIIIPCYNEGARLSTNEFVDYAEVHENVDFVIVNDGSTDETKGIIETLCNRFQNRIFCLNLGVNQGKAEAVRQGFLKAMEMNFKNIGYWDADLATPLTAINALNKLLDLPGITIVLGARIKFLGRRITRTPSRHYLGRVFATFVSLILGIPVYDSQCGAKIFRNNPYLRRVFSMPFSGKWIFDVEILARYKILLSKKEDYALEDIAVEYPLESWTHVSGSKVTLFDFFLSSFELLKLFLYLHAPLIARQYVRKLLAEDIHSSERE